MSPKETKLSDPDPHTPLHACVDGGNRRREASARAAEVVVVNGHHLFGPIAG